MAVLSRLTAVGETVSTLAKAGFLTPMRPDRAVRMIARPATKASPSQRVSRPPRNAARTIPA